MAQTILTLCDMHLDRGEEVPATSYDCAVRRQGDVFHFVTVDLCDACAKPLSDLWTELQEQGREFDDASAAVLTAGKRRKMDAPMDCPVCGKTYSSKGSMRSHVANVHGKTLSEIEGKTGKEVTCDECGQTYAGNQGLSSHQRSTLHRQKEKVTLRGKKTTASADG